MNRIEKSILCTVSENIRKARLKMKYTQNTVAALMEVEPGTISNYECGNCFPTFQNLIKLIEVLEVQPNDILCEKRELTPEEAMMFSVEVPKSPSIPVKKRVRFKTGEAPDIAKEMDSLIQENKKLKEESRKRRRNRYNRKTV
ncbi:MAG: helix-turn-helix transcriptional regulator [Spirochaetales bacterium]|nr:helix-turn-helix transcriptional regulator [Spirochaetales bacterium]